MITAVGQERISTVVGYILLKGNFSEVTPNLPQLIALFAEANHANQSGLNTTSPTQITSAQQAGQTFGFGSPIYNKARIHFPVNGGGSTGGIPLYVYPQAEAGGSVAQAYSITPTGTATANGTHYIVIGGRKSLDGVPYAVNIVVGDTPATISGKISDAINAVLGCPLTGATIGSPVTAASGTAKWRGKTSADVSVSVDVSGGSLGVTYVVASTATGSGTPSIAGALTQIGSAWVTIIDVGYSTETTIMDALEGWNGIPDTTIPTGRYVGTTMRPAIAIIGTNVDDPTAVTDARLAQCTIAIAPAPLSPGQSIEAASNMATLFARIAQDSPELDVQGLYYSDMPIATAAIAMADYNFRDSAVKKGCSTVIINAGRYQIEDFVTTYHPVGETPPAYRYPRNLMLDFNVRYGYYLLEQQYVVGKVLAADADIVTTGNYIKPKQWRAIISNYAVGLGKRALIADVPFMQKSIAAGIDGVNPDRLNTQFRYKRTGVGRISATEATAGFNNG